MLLLAHEDLAAVQQSAVLLQSLGGAARRLLAQVVGEQGVSRTKRSAALAALEDAGFVFVREDEDPFSSKIEINPTLQGEEALEFLDEHNGEPYV